MFQTLPNAFSTHLATASTTHYFIVLISQSSISCLWFSSVHASQCLCVTNRTSTEYKHRWGFPERRKPLMYLELDCFWPHYSFWWQAHFLITSQCDYCFLYILQCKCNGGLFSNKALLGILCQRCVSFRSCFSDCSSAAYPGNVAHNNDVKPFGSSFSECILSNPLCNSQTLKTSLLLRIAGSRVLQLVAI